ncbi:MAG: ATP-dependent sacrificial sulfur transferase LarE [Kiritimatiellia bacterium]
MSTGSDSVAEMFQQLKSMLSDYGRAAVCFSGGVDSTFLAKTAVDVLRRGNVLGILADTPSLPRRELDYARRTAELIGLDLLEVKTCEIDDPAYVSNTADRCYHCKKIIFGTLVAQAQDRGYETVLDGNNSDDAGDFRPGHKAALELGVQSPLMKVGLRKSVIRKISADLNLPTADKPAMSCLSTRVPAGCRISRELLLKIEKAEQVLWDAGFSQVRVRDRGDCACLEIDARDFRIMADEKLRVNLTDGIRRAGYTSVLLDLKPLIRR